MSKIARLVLLMFTISLGMFWQFIARARPAYALADCYCGNWFCYDRITDPNNRNYSVGDQICWCEEEGPSTTKCRSEPCPYPSYVCNRDGQCCEGGVVNTGDDDDSGTNTCGNGVCDAKETCDNCPADCEECCGDGTCNYGEGCLDCEADCGVCPDGIACGDGLCTDGETCDNCWVDCGFCPYCGDYECNGFETCETCEVDCGACGDSSWWQVWGGNFAAEYNYGYVMKSSIPSDTICIEPDCYPYLSVTDRAGTAKSDGFPFLGGGEFFIEDQISSREDQVSAVGTLRTRLRETYSYFYGRYSLGFSPDDYYSVSSEDALEPTTIQETYFRSGDLTIQSPWEVTAGESYVIFVDGNLNIEDPLDVGGLITVDEGGFLAFIVSGDINIADNVGNSTLSDISSNIEGVYVADGTINILSNDAMDKRFVGEGTFVGWTNVSMQRSFDDGPDNELYPTEMFVYRPDLVKYTPEKMKRPQILWQETN